MEKVFQARGCLGLGFLLVLLVSVIRFLAALVDGDLGLAFAWAVTTVLVFVILPRFILALTQILVWAIGAEEHA